MTNKWQTISLAVLAVGLAVVGLQLWHIGRVDRIHYFDNARAIAALSTKLDYINSAADRLVGIDRFRSRFPYFSRSEASALTDAELETTPLELSPVKVEFVEKPTIEPDYLKLTTWKPRYQFTGPAGLSDLPVNKTVATPVISVENADDPYPVVSVPKAFDSMGREASYYFEIDTDPSFSSPNGWRFPTLLQTEFPDDATSIAGLKFNIFRTTQRGVDGAQNMFKFPFRVTAMRLPDWRELDFDEMQKQARALAFNLPTEEVIGEFFRYVRQNYLWSSDTANRTPLDTFVAGLGECGHVNDFLGALLEMNGVRYRGVAGVSPSARVAYPGGGHSAIEVLSPTSGQWSYADPYLDVLLPEVSAEEMARRKDFDRIAVYPVDERYKGFGSIVSLSRIFQYRYYYDKLGRLPQATMVNLFGNEDKYGTNWALNAAPVFGVEDLFEEKKTIYVRARYVFSGSGRVLYASDSANSIENAVFASEWSIKTFAVSPRSLMVSKVH